MLVEKILKNIKRQPKKLAFWWRGEQVSYEDFGALVDTYVRKLTTSNKRVFISSESPVGAIAQLLACQITRNTGLLVSNELPQSQKESIAFKYGFVDFEKPCSADDFIDDYFLGVLTSGSTGNPKVIFKNNSCWESAFDAQSEVFDLCQEDNIFVLDALAYSANLNTVLHGLWLGCSISLGSLKLAKSWGECIVDNNISASFLVPSHLRLLANQEIGNSLQSVVTAGEKLSSSLAREIILKLPDVLLTEYYGTTELGHISFHQNQEIIEDPLSVGSPFPGVSIVIDKQQLYVKSPYVSPEFLTVNTVGDLGSWENGKLILLGRSGRMFNRRGLNIFAQEIEQKALSHIAVEDAYLLERLIGSQKKLHLIFCKKKESPPVKNLPKALYAYLQALLPAAKCPSRIIEVEEIPRFVGGKINENRLVENVYFSELKEEKLRSSKLAAL